MRTQPTSLRERKKARTREKLAKVASSLFLKQGFEATTVSEIAKGADVSPRTFFRYFPTKEAVVFRDHEERVSGFRALLAEHRTPRAPFVGVRRALLVFAESYEAQRDELYDEWRIVTASPLLIARDVELDSEFEAAIAESVTGAGDGVTVDSHTARLFAGAVFGVVRATMQEWYSSGFESSLVALGQHALGLLEVGFGAFGRTSGTPSLRDAGAVDT